MRSGIKTERYPIDMSVAAYSACDLQLKNVEWKEKETKNPEHGYCRGFVFPDILPSFADNIIMSVTVSGMNFEFIVKLTPDLFRTGWPAGCEFDVEIDIDEYGRQLYGLRYQYWISYTIRCSLL